MAKVTLRQLLDHAAEHDYGVPAFNINNMEQGLTIMKAAAACDAPVIIESSFTSIIDIEPLGRLVSYWGGLSLRLKTLTRKRFLMIREE